MSPEGLATGGDDGPMISRAIVERFEYDMGLDVMAVGTRPRPGKKPATIYRIVGKYEWDGGYTSFDV